ncbi:MAG: ATP-binding protein, partial [Thermomicrobiales bacterium]
MIDNDQRPPLFPLEERPPAASTGQESIFSSLGFLTNPFSDDPAGGPFIEASGQTMVLDLLTEWWQEQPGGSLALVTGPTGSGKTRLFLEAQRVVANDNTTRLATVADQGARRSDAQLLKDILIAFAGTPVGRTGLELQAGIRQRFGQIVDAGQRPLLLVDSANFTGSQLEILRSLLTDAPASIVLFGDPDLADRVTRRQSLAALVGFASEIEPFEADDITNLIQQRLAASLANEGDASFQIDDDAWREVNDLVRGNPGR